jgi:uncharacterized protein (DUF1015 family)
MPTIHPFRAIQYAQALTAQPGRPVDLSAVIAPPYDVLDLPGKQALMAQSDHNIVAVDLPHLPAKELGPATAYTSAASLFNTWMTDGTLARRDTPVMFIYRQSFSYSGTKHVRTGLVASVPMQPFGKAKGGGILPHERTFGGAKLDRQALMDAAGIQLSPIFGLMRAATPKALINEMNAFIKSQPGPTVTAKTADGTTHELFTVEDTATLTRLSKLGHNRDIFIADGHHRYTTQLIMLEALASKSGKSGIPADHPLTQSMFVIVDMDDQGLVIGPTHRVLGNLAGYSWQAFLKHARGKLFFTRYTKPLSTIEQALHTASDRAGKNVLGLHDYASGTSWLVTPIESDPLASHPDFRKHPKAWRTLDVALVQHLIIDQIAAPLAADSKPSWAFPHDMTDVQAIGKNIATSSGGGPNFQANLAIIVRPTPLESVRIVSEEGEVMPQKSTYFYPKLATGLFMKDIRPI